MGAYVPSQLDQSVLVGDFAVLGVTLAATGYWWNVLVPAKRTELARDKRDKSEGALGGYLEDLRDEQRDQDSEPAIDDADSSIDDADSLKKLIRLVVIAEMVNPGMFTYELRKGVVVPYTLSAQAAPFKTSSARGSSRSFERWLLADWLNSNNEKKAAALPFLPKAKFNSGDNPILAAMALIMGAGVLFTALGWN